MLYLLISHNPEPVILGIIEGEKDPEPLIKEWQKTNKAPLINCLTDYKLLDYESVNLQNTELQ